MAWLSHMVHRLSWYGTTGGLVVAVVVLVVVVVCTMNVSMYM